MKRFALVAVLLLAGCASPAEDYVRAEAAAWAEYDRDGMLDAWVDASSLTAERKDALHALNEGRRARVSHALAAIASGS